MGATLLPHLLPLDFSQHLFHWDSLLLRLKKPAMDQVLSYSKCSSLPWPVPFGFPVLDPSSCFIAHLGLQCVPHVKAFFTLALLTSPVDASGARTDGAGALFYGDW
jgi:hypothetical protein